MRHRLTIIFMYFLALASCKDSYDIPLTASAADLLVVEGVITGAPELTTITLSKSVGGSEEFVRNPEKGATIIVRSQSGMELALMETSEGVYQGGVVGLDPGSTYQLYIQTSNGKTYESDYVPYIRTPQIDSIAWRLVDRNLHIYANTHDPTNNTRYYRWDYDETFQFHSVYFSEYMYVNGSMLRRNPNNIYTCWRSGKSSKISLASSARLKEDVISMAPLLQIPNGDIKVSVLYSILLRQYGLTQDGYEYWEQLKKNTEQVGTIFDPQPSANKTNVKCISDPGEMVIGYVSAGDITSQRIFIKNSEVAPWLRTTSCQEFTVPLDSLDFYFATGVNLPTSLWQGMTGILGYYASGQSCVDCTLSGTNVKPPFWP